MSSGHTDIERGDTELRETVEPTEPSRIKKAQPPRFQWTNPDVLVGFPQTAHFLAADPDKSTVIFKRFDKASTRNLLNLESRVAALEAVQEKLDREDNTKNWKNIHIAAVAQSWEDFALLGTEMGSRSNSMKIPLGVYMRWNQSREKRLMAEEKDAQKRGVDLPDQQYKSYKYDWGHSEMISCDRETLNLIQLRWDVALAIQDAVKEYQEAVLLHSRMLSLEAPAERSRKTVANWYDGKVTDPKTKTRVKSHDASQFLPVSAMYSIFGAERDTENGSEITKPNDLVSLHSPADDDLISKTIANSRFTYQWFREKGISDSEVTCVREKKIHKWVTFIGLVFAIAFLIVAIWAIYVIKPFVVKLGVLTIFVAVFGVWVNYATTATRSEVFAATAAYAAVLVVYVGKG